MRSANASPARSLRGEPTEAAPSASRCFEVVNRFGVTLATNDSLEAAKADVQVRARRHGISGLTVQEVVTTTRRTVAYRPPAGGAMSVNLVTTAIAKDGQVAKLKGIIRDLLDQIDTLDDYKLTRDLEPFEAEACWDDAIYQAREAIK